LTPTRQRQNYLQVGAHRSLLLMRIGTRTFFADAIRRLPRRSFVPEIGPSAGWLCPHAVSARES
jgi:hypothetical protein